MEEDAKTNVYLNVDEEDKNEIVKKVLEEYKNILEINHDLKDMMIQSLRYALYRHTYALNHTCEYIKKHPEMLDERVAEIMLKDIECRLKDEDLQDFEREDIRCLQVKLENWRGNNAK